MTKPTVSIKSLSAVTGVVWLWHSRIQVWVKVFWV